MSQVGTYIMGNLPPIVATTYHTDAGDAVPAANVLNVLGGANINTAGAGNTVTINLNTSISQPNTNAAATQGMYSLGGNEFMHNYGTSNAFLGDLAGNLTLTPASATANTGIGALSLGALTTGNSNTGIGVSSLNLLTTGSLNTALGFQALDVLLTGSNCIGIGNTAGANYAAGESSNVIINASGTALESNVLTIGSGTGTGAQQLNKALISGIYNRPFGATSGVVQIDNTNTLGSSNGANGQLLIGGGTGPVWANILSAGGTVVITNAANAINLETAGTVATSYHTDAGNAAPAAGILNVLGGANINTSGAGSTVTVSLNTSISLPDTNAAATQGMYSLNGNTFMHKYDAVGGNSNTFLGILAGNLTMGAAAIANTGIGSQSLSRLTTGNANTGVGSFALQLVNSGTENIAVGNSALAALTTSSGNVALGYSAADQLVSGANNIAIGFVAGSLWTTNESNNVVLNFNGTVGQSNTLVIGAGTGTAAKQINTAIISGIYNRPVGVTNGVVLCDNTNTLGSSNGADGQILIGGGTGSVWANITAGAGINITNAANSITVATTGAAGLGTTNHAVQVGNAAGGLTSIAVGATNTVLLGNTGADPSFGQVANAALVNSSVTLNNGNNITVTGGGPLALGGTASFNLTGTTNHALQIGNAGGSLTSLGVATNGQIPIGSTGADPVLATISAGSNITITNGAGTISIAANSGSQIAQYVSVNHAASPYTPLATDYYISADVTAGVITVNLPNAPTTGRIFIIKDKVGLAATSNITVTTVGGVVNIDGATTFVMNTAYESVELIFNGASYEVF